MTVKELKFRLDSFRDDLEIVIREDIGMVVVDRADFCQPTAMIGNDGYYGTVPVVVISGQKPLISRLDKP